MERCSLCKKPDVTVDRDKFDGMCVRCTDRALANPDLIDKAIKENNKMRDYEGHLPIN